MEVGRAQFPNIKSTQVLFGGVDGEDQLFYIHHFHLHNNEPCLSTKICITHVSNRPFYSYVWNQGWSSHCFDTNLPALLCRSSYSYANHYFSRTISITKQRFVSKQGHHQPHIHSKARVLSSQLKNGLFFLGITAVPREIKDNAYAKCRGGGGGGG